MEILKIGSGLSPEVTSHTCNTQQEILHSDVFTTTQKSLERWGEGGCSRQRQGVTHSFCCGDHMFFVYSTLTPASRWSPKTVNKLLGCLLRVRFRFFILRYLFSFCLFHFCICRFFEISSTNPLACGGAPAVFSHQHRLACCRLYTRELAKESLQKVWRLPLEDLRKSVHAWKQLMWVTLKPILAR